MEIPATPGTTGAIYGAGPSYEESLKEAFEKQFGPIPSGLAFREVNEAFQGPFMGVASVGVYPPPPPPAEQAEYPQIAAKS